MQVTYATQSTPGRPNEDFVACGSTWWLVLDGATAPAGVDSGCVHTVAWLVQHLGGILAEGITGPLTLPDLLADSIRVLRDRHGGLCNLDNPASPSSTVTIARARAGMLEYLVLADSPIVLDTTTGVHMIVDDRTAYLRDYSIAGVQAARNRDGGFWVASTDPEAAYRAVTGSIALNDVHRIALLSDGASRWVERFGAGTWSDLVAELVAAGPDAVIEQVRELELAETDEQRISKRGKRHDDATAVLVNLAGAAMTAS